MNGVLRETVHLTRKRLVTRVLLMVMELPRMTLITKEPPSARRGYLQEESNGC